MGSAGPAASLIEVGVGVVLIGVSLLPWGRRSPFALTLLSVLFGAGVALDGAGAFLQRVWSAGRGVGVGMQVVADAGIVVVVIAFLWHLARVVSRGSGASRS